MKGLLFCRGKLLQMVIKDIVLIGTTPVNAVLLSARIFIHFEVAEKDRYKILAASVPGNGLDLFIEMST